MKLNRVGLACVENKFLKLPNIQKYEVVSRTEDGFIASVEMDDGYEFQIYASFLNRVFPSTVIKLIEKQNKSQKVNILVAPYISERTAQICEDNGMGYFDYAGNCWFVGHSIYLSEKEIRIQDLKSKGLCQYLKGLLWCLHVFCVSCSRM